MTRIKCENCGRDSEHHAKKMCTTCYKKLNWKPKRIKCKRCNRTRPLHAKGLCNGCYNSVFHIDKTKEYQMRKYHNIDQKKYNQLTKVCTVCGFNKIIELHHLDKDTSNNSDDNLVGLCPNHHRMLHNRLFRKEVCLLLKEKGFNPPEGYKDDEFFKKITGTDFLSK